MFSERGDNFLLGWEQKEPFAQDLLAVQQDCEFAAIADDGFGGNAQLRLDGGCRPGS